MNKKKQLLLIVAIGLLAGPIAAQAQYNYELFVPDDSDDIQVFGINDRGDVVGNGIDEDGGPFVYASKKGTFTGVEPAADYDFTSVLGVNDAGVMVGSVFSEDDEISRGFIRDKKGNYTVFLHPGAVTETQPRGVNNKGLVAGFRDGGFVPFPIGTPDFTARIGFIYDPKTKSFTDINAVESIRHDRPGWRR